MPANIANQSPPKAEEELHYVERKYVIRMAASFILGVLCLAASMGYVYYRFTHLVCYGWNKGLKPYAEHQVSKDVTYVWHVSKKLHHERTKYQNIEVFMHPHFGYILVIDKSLQITQADEFMYHEMMAHVPLAYVPEAKHVLVIGGGDGGALWRLLQHKNIQTAELIDIDLEAMEFISRTYYPSLHEGGYQDPRTTAYAADGAKWVSDALKKQRRYDVILVDSTDFGAADSLFTAKFYQDLASILTEDGVLVSNLDSPSWNYATVVLVQTEMGKYFNHSFVYAYHQTCFLSGHYSFLFLSKSVHPFKAPVDWQKSWYDKNISSSYYNPDVHVGSFLMPHWTNQGLTTTTSLQELHPTTLNTLRKPERVVDRGELLH